MAGSLQAGVVLACTLALACLAGCNESMAAQGFELDEALLAGTAATGEGFLVYCHCMGRFGNQVDHLLGALAWAKRINRTLVIPPFIEYSRGVTSFRPFAALFDLRSINEYHFAVDMETFMAEQAPAVWPAGNRSVYCISNNELVDCRAKNGNPPGTFWDHFHVDFAHQIGHQLHYASAPSAWAALYPPALYPVVATSNAPGPYPVMASNRALQRYLRWNRSDDESVNRFLAHHIGNKSWIAAHFRAGSDWTRACQHAEGLVSYMSSPQCLLPSPGVVTAGICLPSAEQAAQEVLTVMIALDSWIVFVGTDNQHYADKVRPPRQKF